MMDIYRKRSKEIDQVLYLEDVVGQNRIRRKEDVDLICILRQALERIGGMDDADRVC